MKGRVLRVYVVEQEDAQRLVKLCGLLGSDHDGERANAAFMATKLLRMNDMTWADLVARAMLPAPSAPMPHWSTVPKTEEEWSTAIRARCWDRLTHWEKDFLASILQRDRWPLSERQRGVLDKLRERYVPRVYA